MSNYPIPSDYQMAVQNPQYGFSDSELRSCQVRMDPRNLPIVSSGGFALTYYLSAPGDRKYVVRCFQKDSVDRRERYDAICRFLHDNSNPIFLNVDYLERGILVNGKWYPVVKMPLVEGMTLQRYVEGEISAGRSIADLPDKFRRVVTTLETFGVAHGDLQHGNIMVRNGELVLIDYDGMYVPALKGRQSAESGNPAYQHPSRNEQFLSELDRFSSIVIDMALRALVVDPGLWMKYSNGDNMLFRESDFMEPDGSKLLRELEAIPALRSQVSAFRSICKGPLEDVPRLFDFAAGKAPSSHAQSLNWLPATTKKRATVYDGHNRAELLKHVGEQVTIVGKILAVRVIDRQQRPYAFMNFGDYRTCDLSLVIWPDVLDLFRQQQKPPEGYMHQWVRVTGLLTSYKPNDRGIQPQIVINVPTQIEILKGGEAEAKQLLTGAANQDALSRPASAPATTASSTSPSTGAGPVPRVKSEAALYNQLNRLYPGQPEGAAQLSPASNAAPSFTALNLHTSPAELDFGRVQAGRTAVIQMEIRNTGQLPTIVSFVGQPPFLQANTPSINCPIDTAARVEVKLDAAAIPPDKRGRKLSITGNDEEFSLTNTSLSMRCGRAEQLIPVRATIVQSAPVVLTAPTLVSLGIHLLPSGLDFRRIEEGRVVTKQIRIVNIGNQDRTVTVQGLPPFLVVNHSSILLMAGKETNVDVSLDASAVSPNHLERKPFVSHNWEEFALKDVYLVIACDGAEHKAMVAAIVAKPSQRVAGASAVGTHAPTPTTLTSLGVRMMPLPLDFGRVESGQTAVVQMKLMNTGSQPRVVSLECTVAGLAAKQTSIDCPIGKLLSVDVQLDPGAIPSNQLERDPAALGTAQEFKLKDVSLVLRCGKLEQTIPVIATVVRPLPGPQPPQVAALVRTSARSSLLSLDIHSMPLKLDFCRVVAGETATIRMSITNTGHQLRVVRFEKRDLFLRASPSQVDCPAGKTVCADISLDSSIVPPNFLEPKALVPGVEPEFTLKNVSLVMRSDGGAEQIVTVLATVLQIAPAVAPKPPTYVDNTVVSAPTSPTMQSLGIQVLPPLLDFGRLSQSQTISRELQIKNVGRLPAVVSLEGQPPFLTPRQSPVTVGADLSVNVSVQLDASLIPSHMFNHKQREDGNQQESTLEDTSLLLRCGAAAQLIAVDAKVVQSEAVVLPPQPPAAEDDSRTSVSLKQQVRKRFRLPWFNSALIIVAATLAVQSIR